MTAILLTKPDADREEWLEARQAGIGASEIAAVMGISPYDSPFSIWWRKRNCWDADLNDEMQTGTFLEHTIASWYAEHRDPNKNMVIDRAGLYQHPDRPWQLATPDRLILALDSCGGLCDEPGLIPNPDSTFFIEGFEPCFKCISYKLVGLLECKWVAYSWDGWGEEDTDDVPVHYRAQALWQLDVMGVDEVIICALGPGGFRTYRIRRDEKDLTAMREAGRRFWQSLIDDIPPLPDDDHIATAATLKRLHPSVEDIDIQVPLEFAEGYRRAREIRNRAIALVDKYEVRARALLGSGRRLVYGKQLVVSRSVYDQSGDLAELDSLDGDCPTVDRLNPGRAKSYVN